MAEKAKKETKQARYINTHRKLGLCYACNNPSKSYSCHEHKLKRNANWLKLKAKKIENGICYKCGIPIPEEFKGRLVCINCSQKLWTVRVKE